MRTLAIVLLALGAALAAAMLAYLFAFREDVSPGDSPPTKAPAAVPAPAAPPAPETPPAEALPAPEAVQEPAAPTAEAAEQEYKIIYHGLVQQATDATPVASAKVTFLDDDEVVADAETDDTGAYRIEATLDNWDLDSFAITCEAKGFSRVLKSAKELGTQEAGAEIRYDFNLAPGAALTGLVTTNDSGGAVAGVEVQLRPRETGFNEERFRRRPGRAFSAESDDEGRYAFLSLPAGVFELSVDSGEKNLILSGTDSRMLNVAAASTQELDLVLEAGATVQGALTTSDGAEPEHPRVVLKRDQAKGMMKRIMEAAESMMDDRTEIEEGRYKIDGLRFGENYRLRAVAEGYAPTQTETFSISPGQSPLTRDLELARGSSVSGIVQYSGGEPAPEQRVMLMPDLSSIMAGELPESDTSAKTDARGAFTIAGIGPGKYSVMAGKPSFPFGKGDNSAQVELDGVNDVKDIVLEVGKPAAKNTTPKDGAIKGKVVDENNAPAANATVEAKIFGVKVKSVTTEEDGAFAITELDDVKYDLVARSENGEGEAKQVSVGSEVTIKLAGATQVSGVVVDTAGEPVAQCGVNLEKQSADQSQLFDPEMFQNMMGMGGKGAATDEFGYFAFKHVGPGKYIVKAVASGRGSGESELLEVQAGKSIDNLKITMQAGVLFSGAVVDSSGKGVEGVEVALYMTGGGGGMFQEQMAQFMPQEMQQATMSAFSEAQGAFVMQGVPPGGYRLGATHPQYARTVVKDLVFAAGHDVTNYTVTISAGGCLSGVPLLQGESRKGLMVQAIGDNGMEMTTTGEDGAFEICGLAPGRYMVQAMDMSAMMSGNFSAMMPVQRTAEVRENETTVVEFGAVEGAVAVTGTVGGELGTMTTVTLRDPASPAPAELDPFDMAGQIEMMDQMGGNTLVGPDGTFTMENVKPGEYILEVYSFNFDMQAPNMQELMETARTPLLQQNVTVRAGESPHFELEIPAE